MAGFAPSRPETLTHAVARMRTQGYTDAQIGAQVQKWHPDWTPQEVTTHTGILVGGPTSKPRTVTPRQTPRSPFTPSFPAGRASASPGIVTPKAAPNVPDVLGTDTKAAARAQAMKELQATAAQPLSEHGLGSMGVTDSGGVQPSYTLPMETNQIGLPPAGIVSPEQAYKIVSGWRGDPQAIQYLQAKAATYAPPLPTATFYDSQTPAPTETRAEVAPSAAQKSALFLVVAAKEYPWVHNVAKLYQLASEHQQYLKQQAAKESIDPTTATDAVNYATAHHVSIQEGLAWVQHEAYLNQGGLGGAVLRSAVQPFIAATGANIVAKIANGQKVTAGDIVSTVGNAALTATGQEALRSIVGGAQRAEEAASAIRSASRVQLEQTLHSTPGIAAGEVPHLMKAADEMAHGVAKAQGLSVEQVYGRIESHFVDLSPKESDLAGAHPQLAPMHETPPERVAANVKQKQNPKNAEKGLPVNDIVTPKSGIKLFGQQTTDEWLAKVEKYTPDVQQRLKDAAWYSRVEPEFKRVFGPGYKPIMRGFLASQANAGPADGLASTLHVLEKLERMAPIGTGVEHGVGSVVADAIAKTLAGEKLDKGQAAKLSDFIDSARGKVRRTWMGNLQSAGEPAAGDIWSGRDAGYIDKKIAKDTTKGRGATLQSHVLREHGVDMKALEPEYDGTLSGNRYERISEFYNRLSSDLNTRGYLGKHDWKASEVQALGWMNMQRVYGRRPQEIPEWVSSALDKFKRKVTRAQLVEAERHIGANNNVHLLAGSRRDLMEMQPNPKFLYHGTNAEGANGILSSGKIEARPTERSPESPAAWLTDHPARAAAQGDHVLAIPRSNVEHQLSSHPLGMHSSLEDVHIFGNPEDSSTAMIHSEAVPQAELHAKQNARYERLDWNGKAAYARAVDNAITDGHFERVVGLPSRGSHYGVGVWRGEANPGIATHYAVTDLNPDEVAKLNALSAAQGMAKEQGSVSWGRPLPLSAKGDNVFSAVVGTAPQDPATLAKIGSLADEKFGNGMIGVIHGPHDSIYLVDFHGDTQEFAQRAQELLGSSGKEIKWQGGYTIDERLKTEPWETTFQQAIKDAPNAEALTAAVDHVHSVVQKIQSKMFTATPSTVKYESMLNTRAQQLGHDTSTGLSSTAREHAEEDLHAWADANPQSPYAGQFKALADAHTAEQNSLEPEMYFAKENPLLGSIAKAQGTRQFLQAGDRTVKGATQLRGAKASVYLFRDADASTALHELAHVFQDALPSELKATIRDPEHWARSFEQYIARGQAPSRELQPMFDSLANSLRNVYGVGDAIPGADLTGDMRQALDKFFTGRAQHDEEWARATGSSWFAQMGKGYRIVDEHNPDARTLWHNGEDISIAEANRRVSSEGANGEPFHLHALDEQGNLVGARHGLSLPDRVHMSSIHVVPEWRGRGIAYDMSTMVRNHAGERPISADFINEGHGDREIERSIRERRSVGEDAKNPSRMLFQTEHEYTPSRDLAYHDLLVHPRPARSDISRALVDRPVDAVSTRIEKVATKLREDKHPLAKLAGKALTPFSTRSRVPRIAAKNFVEDMNRVRSNAHGALHTLARLDTRLGLHALNPGEGEGIAHYWWAQLPKSERNAEGLKKIQDKLMQEYEYVSNPDGAFKDLNADLEELQATRPSGEGVTASDVFSHLSEEAKVKQRIAELPDTIQALQRNIAKLERIIRKPPAVSDEALHSISQLMDERKSILMAAGVLKPEVAAERESLVARYLGMESDGSEIYVGHRAGDLSRGASFPRGASFGGTRTPRGAARGHRNEMVLFRHGMLQQSMESIVKDWAAAQGYQAALRAKNDLARMGEPVMGYLKPDHVLVNPAGQRVPRAIHTDPEAQAQTEGLNIDDLTELQHNLFAETTPEQQRMMDAAHQMGNLHELRQVPKDVAAKYYEAILGKRASVATPGIRPEGLGNTLGKALDTVTNGVYMSLIYTNPGYVPSILMQNMVFAGLHQGAFLPQNLYRAGKLLAHGPKDVADLIKGEVGVGALESLAAGKSSNVTHNFIRHIHTVPDTWPRTAAFLHEMARNGIIKKAGALDASDYNAIRDLFRNPAKVEQLRELANYARQSQVDFNRLRPTEQALARRLLFVWPWIRGISAWPGRYALDHPIQTAGLAAYIGAGKAGYVPFPNLVTKNVPTWLQESIPAGHQVIDGKSYPKVMPTRYINPASTPIDLFETMTGAPGAAVINSLLNPIIGTAWHLGNKEDRFGHASSSYWSSFQSNLESLVPNYALIQDLAHPPDVAHAGLYPGDTSRIGRIERALRIFPFPYDPVQALKDSEKQGLQGSLAHVHDVNLTNDAKRAGFGTVPPQIVAALDHKTALDHISSTHKSNPQDTLKAVVQYYDKTTGRKDFDRVLKVKLPDPVARTITSEIRAILIGPGLSAYEGAIRNALEAKGERP